MNKESINREIKNKISLINEALSQYLPEENEVPETIHRSMRYSVLAGGKRIRPVLFLSAAEAVGGSSHALMPAACALEIIHTYSLIHDDLPAMDNDDYRRGKPTNHKVFGEAIAILTGDALLTLAFSLISRVGLTGACQPETVLKVIQEISTAAGSLGMIGGQVVDIQSENKTVNKELLEYIHNHKTGALFRVSVRSGALLGGGTEKQVRSLTSFAEYLGLAFQITDDILDVEGDSEKLGKNIGSDERKKKCTYPVIYGLEKSKKMAAEVVDKAVSALQDFGAEADLLRYIASYLLLREK